MGTLAVAAAGVFLYFAAKQINSTQSDLDMTTIYLHMHPCSSKIPKFPRTQAKQSNFLFCHVAPVKTI